MSTNLNLRETSGDGRSLRRGGLTPGRSDLQPDSLKHSVSTISPRPLSGPFDRENGDEARHMPPSAGPSGSPSACTGKAPLDPRMSIESPSVTNTIRSAKECEEMKSNQDPPLETTSMKDILLEREREENMRLKAEITELKNEIKCLRQDLSRLTNKLCGPDDGKTDNTQITQIAAASCTSEARAGPRVEARGRGNQGVPKDKFQTVKPKSNKYRPPFSNKEENSAIITTQNKFNILEQTDNHEKDDWDKNTDSQKNQTKPPQNNKRKASPQKLNKVKKAATNEINEITIVDETESMQTDTANNDNNVNDDPDEDENTWTNITKQHDNDNFQSAPKSRKIPPIVVMDENFRSDEFDEIMKQDEIRDYRCKVNATNIIIKPQNSETHKRIRKYLDDKNIQYYTYLLPEDRHIRVVIKGIPKYYQESKIEADLINENFSPLKVAQMTRRKNGEVIKLSSYLVHLPSTDPMSKTIYQLRYLGRLVVRVEKYKNKGGPQQCHRCQGFYHSAIGCKLDPNCMKCGQMHLTHECSKPKDTDATCVNCKGNHPSCYKGCPKRLELINNKTLKTNKGFKPQQAEDRIITNKTYAEAVKLNEAQKTTKILDEAKATLRSLEGLIGILNNINCLPLLEKAVQKIVEEEITDIDE